MRYLATMLLTLALLLGLAPGQAGAHGYLERSSPADGEQLLRAPAHVQMWFTEALVGRVSSAELIGPDGNAVPGTTVSNPEPSMMQMTVPALSPGTYTARWRVLSVDTHVTEGSFNFTIVGQAAPPPTQPQPAPPAPPVTAPTPAEPAPTEPAPTEPQPAEAEPEPAPEPAAPEPSDKPEPAEPTPAPPADQPDGGGPNWPVIGGGLLIGALVAGALLARRRKR